MEKTFALIFGGEGEERRISELSAAAVLNEFSDGIRVIKIGISPDGDWYIFSGENEKIRDGSWLLSKESLTPAYPVRLDGECGFYTRDGIIKADAAFPLLHGDFGEDGVIQAALSAAHIPYIGSDVTSSAITSDKAFTKIIAEHLMIPTVPWFAPEGFDKRRIKKEAEARLGYPMFIKPRRLGSSIGASPVLKSRDFYGAYENALSERGGGVIIERLIPIKSEIEFALFCGSKKFISREGIISTNGKFYDYSAKYEGLDSPETYTDKSIDRATARKARSYARRLSDYLGLGSLSRIDFFIAQSGELFFNEINSVPGMTEDSLYPRLAKESGCLKLSAAEALLLSGNYR